jgi:hypothetical protein
MQAFACACVLAIQLTPAPSTAQMSDQRWLVLPSVVATQGDPKHPARATARLINEELRSNGQHTFATEEAQELFEQLGSTPPMTASAADIDELAKDAQRALYHVASGLPQRAKKDVERALTRARRALESLNRETRAAQHLLDACLYLVRAHLQHGDRGAARSQALECRRLVPDIAPEPTVHPPDVIGVLAEAQAQLRSHEPPSLRIESEPSGCAAYVNGRNLGPTPKELSQLSPGEYRLQVECEPGVMGRVHRIALVNSRFVAKVDTRFDRAIETLFDLSLHYASRQHESDQLGRDAVETARIVGASDAVVAWVRSAQGAPVAEVQIDRYRVRDGVRLAQARVRVDPTSGSIAQAELQQARVALTAAPQEHADVAGKEHAPAKSERVSSPAPASTISSASDSAPPEEHEIDLYEEPRDDDVAIMPIVGYSIGGVGLVAHVAGWVLYGQLLDARSRYTDALQGNAMPTTSTSEELTALRDMESAESAPFIASGIGAALSVAALPMWLPKSDGVPWWGYVSGAAGAGLAITGAVLTANESSCTFDRYMTCTEPSEATHLGPMLLLQSAAFLAVPVVQAVRALTDDGVSASIEVTQHGAAFQLEGRM